MNERVALVTGASRGIGAEIAKGLGEDGFRVAVGYSQDKDGALQTVDRCSDALAVRIDVRDEEGVASAFDEVETQLGPVSVLVNNAGITKDRLLIRMREEDWLDVIEVDLNGAFRCTKRALPSMLAERWGRIVSIGSVVGTMGNPGQANYAAAKAGLIGFSKALSKEVGRRGVTVNVVSPGLVETQLTAVLSNEAKDELSRRTHTGRDVEATEVADAVRFLVASPSVTGQVIAVDGGIQ